MRNKELAKAGSIHDASGGESQQKGNVERRLHVRNATMSVLQGN
jgi:hypothetical protein